LADELDELKAEERKMKLLVGIEELISASQLGQANGV
jgi:hypothetical protein